MSLPIPPGSYGIDTVHTQLGFSVTHLGISVVRGSLDRFSGTLTVGETLGDTALSLEAEMSSVNSGNAKRDEHLHGADFFAVAEHPTLTFASTSISEAGAGYSLTGDLTIKGTTQSVTLEAIYNGEGVFPADQSTHFGFGATGTISRSSFEITYGVSMVSDDVALVLEAQFVRPAAA
jgi:polyisoprenoid-binding protein YceI